MMMTTMTLMMTTTKMVLVPGRWMSCRQSRAKAIAAILKQKAVCGVYTYCTGVIHDISLSALLHKHITSIESNMLAFVDFTMSPFTNFPPWWSSACLWRRSCYTVSRTLPANRSDVELHFKAVEHATAISKNVEYLSSGLPDRLGKLLDPD